MTLKTAALTALTALTLSAGPAMAQWEGFTPQYDTSGRSDMVSMPWCHRVYMNGNMPGEYECYDKENRMYSTVGDFRRYMAQFF